MTMPPTGSLADSVAYAAARYRRQVLTLSELRELVDNMMYQDIWYDEFVEVLEPPEGGRSNLLPVIEKMLGHVGLPMPNVRDADLLLISRLLRPIAQADIDPVIGLHEFMRQYAW